MTSVIRIHCDYQIPYGVCVAESAPARTMVEAKSLAQGAGWLLHDERDLCPAHCGGKPRGSERSTVSPLKWSTTR